MINMRFKTALFISLSALSLCVNAQMFASKESLVTQCRELAYTVSSLISSQEKKTCVEKLGLASAQIENAGDLIVDDAYSFAKHELDNAMYALQYAELNSCNHYIQISHAKLEAQRLRHFL